MPSNHSGRRQRRSSTSTSIFSDISFDNTDSIADSLYSNDFIFTSSPPPEYPLPERPAPTVHEPVVVCEFVNLLGCEERFDATDFVYWKQHMIDHIGGRLPQRSGCPFCSQRTFDSNATGGNKETAFDGRFKHIVHHFRMGYTPSDMRSDRKLADFMYQNGVLSEELYMMVPYPGGGFRAQPQIGEVYEGEIGEFPEGEVIITPGRRGRRDRDSRRRR